MWLNFFPRCFKISVIFKLGGIMINLNTVNFQNSVNNTQVIPQMPGGRYNERCSNPSFGNEVVAPSSLKKFFAALFGKTETRASENIIERTRSLAGKKLYTDVSNGHECYRIVYDEKGKQKELKMFQGSGIFQPMTQSYNLQASV